MIGLNISYNADDDVVNVESSGGMKQLSEPCNSYWMCKGWGLLPDWVSERGVKHMATRSKGWSLADQNEAT